VAQRVAGTVGFQPAGYEPIGYQSLGYRVKRALLGRPLPTSRLVHERLRKLVALAVFSSDAISSTAYGTEQIMLVLVAAGAAATRLALPIALGIGALLAILILSYRQTITAYPSAGGAYIVTKNNFGPRLAQVAGSALLIDYVLTVSVSVTSGVAAVTTAVPPLQRWILPLSLVAIALIAWANLVGVRESGRIFAVPTYVFVGSCALMLLVGLGRQLTGHLAPIPDSQTAPLPPQTATVGLLLVLHAFASGCTALTGVEAISNGVPAFRRPEAQNARRTLIAMGAILGTLFIGVSYLAVHTHVRPYDSGNPTLIGQLASWVLGTSPAGRVFFYLFQAATLAILVLAANTSYADFPRLASFAATDAFLPRQFTKRGHRLVFSNGIITLSVAAAAVIVAFAANYNRMLPLYAIGVFTSFTLSQAGMTRRHLRLREPGWRYGIVVNGLGALVTFVVLLDIVQTKFAGGAWMVLIALPLLVFVLGRTNRAYTHELSGLKVEVSEALAPPKPRHEVVVFLDHLDRASLGALQYAASLTRCRSPPCTWPPTRMRPSGWRPCGPRSRSRCRWRCSTARTATWSPAPSGPSTSGSGPTPRSPCCCRVAAMSGSGSGCCTTRPAETCSGCSANSPGLPSPWFPSMAWTLQPGGASQPPERQDGPPSYGARPRRPTGVRMTTCLTRWKGQRREPRPHRPGSLPPDCRPGRRRGRRSAVWPAACCLVWWGCRC
jgi:amino acid transporter